MVFVCSQKQHVRRRSKLLINHGIPITAPSIDDPTKADLEFLIERVERLRREQALKPLYTMVGSAAIVIAWIEIFWRHC
jgi:hypothetical protein